MGDKGVTGGKRENVHAHTHTHTHTHVHAHTHTHTCAYYAMYEAL